MKILIYGLQSSGATSFAYLMSQRKNTIAVLDLYYNELAPNLTHEFCDIVMKCTITNIYTIEQQIHSFQPDKTILFCRNLHDVYESLSKKPHANFGGTIEEKLSLFKDIEKNKSNLFDLKYSYEQMICRKIDGLDFFIDSSAYNSNRTIEDILQYNCEQSTWCADNYVKKWQIGCINPRTGNVNIKKEFDRMLL